MASSIGKGFTGNYADAENGWVVTMNENLALTVDGLPLDFGQDRSTTTGLTYGYRGGVCIAADGVVTTVADGTVALTDAATNYVERDRAGAVSANTSEFTPGSLPMAEVVCAAGAITAVTDRRTFAAQGPTQADLDAKADLAGATFTGDVNVPDEAYDATAWNGSTEVPTKNAIRDKIEALGGGGDALTANPLSQFAATTSAELAGVLSDETGTGLAVFNNAPTLVNPVVGTQSANDNSTKAASTAYADRAATREVTAWAALTDGATITWDVSGVRESKKTVTLGGNRALDITNAVNGSSGILRVTQDGTGSRTLTLPTGSKIVGGGGTAPTLSTAAGKVDLLAFEYDGTNYWWTVGLDAS